MEAIYEDIVETRDVFKNYHIVQSWSLSQTLLGVAVVISLYLFLVTKLLPAHMKKRQPFQLKNVLLFYNGFQVAFSAYLVFIVINEIYPYFIAKHLDLLDTVFFVLRKKTNQITFLHLYHHTAMVTWTWLHLMHHPCDHFVVVGMLNSFVHVLMYAYYGIASLGPKYAKYIWWKKHLTKVQLVQFILVVSHLHYQQKLSPCPIPAFFHYFCMTLISSFFVLFIKFYFSSYKTRKAKVAEVSFAEDELLKAR